MRTKQLTKNTVKTVWYTFVSSSACRWFQNAIILIVFSLVVNHLAASDNFLDSQSYRFPTIGFLFTIVLCILVGIIANINFEFYKKKHFSKKVEIDAIGRFIASTLGYITIIYIPINIIVEIVAGGEIQFYYILIGLLISLLLCFIFIGLLYTQDLYNSVFAVKARYIFIGKLGDFRTAFNSNFSSFY